MKLRGGGDGCEATGDRRELGGDEFSHCQFSFCRIRCSTLTKRAVIFVCVDRKLPRVSVRPYVRTLCTFALVIVCLSC